jgi:serine/threonine protein phosphatase PrpC
MVRSENQDSYGVFPEDTKKAGAPKGQLFVVADGMGGHKAGREASSLAVQTLADSYFSAATDDILESLIYAFREANHRVYDQSTSDTAYAGMGTTCTALVLKDSNVVIGHIGDSRVYRVTRKTILQLTEDHSRVADLVRRAIITKEQARIHPERSQLYRALGTRSEVDVDYLTPSQLPDDCIFVLCTDGLSNHVSEDEVQSLVLAKPPGEACDALVQLANERGGHDNITVQVIHTAAAQRGVKKILRRGRR